MTSLPDAYATDSSSPESQPATPQVSGEYVPPHTSEGRDLWHVLIVGDADNEDDRLWLHPDECPLYVSTRGGSGYECQTAVAIANAGYYGIFGRHDDSLRRGTWLVRPYVEKIVGPTWTEWDGGWDVVRLVEGEYDVDAGAANGGDAGAPSATAEGSGK